jgi:hypothetical protein
MAVSEVAWTPTGVQNHDFLVDAHLYGNETWIRVVACEMRSMSGLRGVHIVILESMVICRDTLERC